MYFTIDMWDLVVRGRLSQHVSTPSLRLLDPAVTDATREVGRTRARSFRKSSSRVHRDSKREDAGNIGNAKGDTERFANEPIRRSCSLVLRNVDARLWTRTRDERRERA